MGLIHVPEGRKLFPNLTVRDNKDVETSSIQVNYSGIISSVKKGSKITIDNGLINFKVLSKDKFSLKCRVVDGGELGSKRHVNLPGIRVDLPSITKKDKKFKEICIKHVTNIIIVKIRLLKKYSEFNFSIEITLIIKFIKTFQI